MSVSSSSSPVLDEGLFQLWPQAGQAVVMTAWETETRAHIWHLAALLCHTKLEVQVRGAGTEQVQYVGSAVISHDAFSLNARTKLHLAVVVVEHLVTLNS